MFVIQPTLPGDMPAVEILLDKTFGLTRRVKSSYRLREGSQAIAGLSFIAVESSKTSQGSLVGSISFWPIRIGDTGYEALLLGPLAVHPHQQNRGIGMALMQTGIAAAGQIHTRLIILVGDEPYYARVGFKQIPLGQITMAGVYDPKRLLALELSTHALENAHGLAVAPWRFDPMLTPALAVPHKTKAE